jgi:drug/metabolite transporter (DMT)-like permease
MPLWVLFTLIAATAQTFRNAAQKELTGRLGTLGATHVRFLFGLPFALLFLAAAAFASDLPSPTGAFLAWTILGGASQIGATALMLSAMRERSFVVAIAYTKTEPVQVALFATVFLGELVTAGMAAAILIATAGVLVLAWPARGGGEIFSWRPALFGIVSGALFALAAVGYRGGIVALGSAPYVAAATLTLSVALAVQTAALSLWLLARSPTILAEIFVAWRPSLAAGFLGAFASEMWFLAFALMSPAPVRTLGLAEIFVAGLVSRRLFSQIPTIRDLFGLALLVAGLALLLTG